MNIVFLTLKTKPARNVTLFIFNFLQKLLTLIQIKFSTVSTYRNTRIERKKEDPFRVFETMQLPEISTLSV
jgi:hypothetical protein